MVLFSITEVLYVYVTWLVCMFVLYMLHGWWFVCVCISDRIANVYIVNGLQPNGQCEFELQGQFGFRLQCLVLPANWAVWIQTVAVWIQTAVFSPASQLGSMDSDCSSVDSEVQN